MSGDFESYMVQNSHRVLVKLPTVWEIYIDLSNPLTHTQGLERQSVTPNQVHRYRVRETWSGPLLDTVYGPKYKSDVED